MMKHVSASFYGKSNKQQSALGRNVLLACILLVLTAFSTQGHTRRYDGSRGQDYYRNGYGHGGRFGQNQTEEHEKYLNQHFRGKKRMNLIRVMNFQRSDWGKELVGLGIQATSAAGKGKARIKINGQVQGPKKTLPKYLYGDQEIYFDLPGQQELGPQVQKFTLEIRGNIQLDKVTVYTKKGFGQGGGRTKLFRRYLNKFVSAYDNLKVGKAFKSQYQQLKGGKLKKVVLNVEQMGHATEAQLVLNGQGFGPYKFIDGNYHGQSELVFDVPHWAPEVIGQELKSVQVKFTGQAKVKKVQIEVNLQRHSRPPRGPRNPRNPRGPREPRNPQQDNFSAPLQQRAVGHTETTLVNEVQMPFGLQTRYVKKMQLKVKVKGNARLTLCKRNIRHQAGNCKRSKPLKSGRHTISVPPRMKAKDIMIVSDGYIEFKAVRLKF